MRDYWQYATDGAVLIKSKSARSNSKSEHVFPSVFDWAFVDTLSFQDFPVANKFTQKVDCPMCWMPDATGGRVKLRYCGDCLDSGSIDLPFYELIDGFKFRLSYTNRLRRLPEAQMAIGKS